jgi:DNA-binding YbaB/EbfC family protein
MAKGFKGFPGSGGNSGGDGNNNLKALLQQAQSMQVNIERAQREADAFEGEGSAGGGAVKVIMDGQYNVKSVSINPEACDPKDVEVLQDMVRLAVNDVVSKVRKNTEQKLAQVTGGFSMPGIF